MGRQVEVRTVCNTLKLAPVAARKTELVFDVDGALGVVGKLLLRVLEVAKVLTRDTEVDVPVGALLQPVLVPLLIRARLNEELQFHLLELAGAENEVTGRDLVAEGLTDLADAERRLHTSRSHDVTEVHEDTLGGLGTKVVHAGLILDGTKVGLQHHVEVAGLGPLPAVAARRTSQFGHLNRVRIVNALRSRTPPASGPRGTACGTFMHSVSGSLKTSTWPEATHTWLGKNDRRIETDDVIAAR